MKNHVHAKFTIHFLHPRYWLSWFSMGMLYLLVQLPYCVIYAIGKRLGRCSMRFLSRRVAIATQNLTLCFPHLSDDARDEMLVKNFEATGIALVETGMAWFWSDKRLLNHVKIEGIEYLTSAEARQHGVLLLGMHFLTLELGARLIGIHRPGVGVYRPNDNPVLDYVQTRGRLKSNKYMLDRYDIRGMIRSLKHNEVVWYAPDHDYGPANSVFVPFFAVERAATTIGTSILMRTAKPLFLPFLARCEAHAKGYTFIIKPPLEGFPYDDEIAAAAFTNKAVEAMIMLAPEQYMWLHRRFKTRPEGEESLYK